MKYIKGDQTEPIESYKQSRISLTDGIDFRETPWVGLIPNTNKAVLLNHALAFTPHESWGAVIPSRGFNFLDMLEKQELTLHPEAWETYLERKIIDEDGNYIKK